MRVVVISAFAVGEYRFLKAHSSSYTQLKEANRAVVEQAHNSSIGGMIFELHSFKGIELFLQH